MTDKEKIYDDEITPVLLGLAKRCEESGLSFVAFVEWDPERLNQGGSGSTSTTCQDRSAATEIAYLAARRTGNIDQMLINVIRFAKHRGISLGGSMFLHQYEEVPE